MITRGNGPVDESYFMSLIKPTEEKKKRPCVRCRVEFISRHRGNRICAQCGERRHTVGAMALNAVPLPDGFNERLVKRI